MRFTAIAAAVMALTTAAFADNVDNCKESCSYSSNGCDDEGSCAINCITCTNRGVGVPQGVCGCEEEPSDCDTECKTDCWGHCEAFQGSVYDMGVAVCQSQCDDNCGC